MIDREEPSIRSEARSAKERWGFAVWAVLGTLLTLSLISLGPFLLIPVGVVIVVAATRPSVRQSWFGVFVGAGLVSLLVAILNRAGPGTTCWQTANAGGCDEWLDPRPWLIGGVAFIALGLWLQARSLKR